MMVEKPGVEAVQLGTTLVIPARKHRENAAATRG